MATIGILEDDQVLRQTLCDYFTLNRKDNIAFSAGSYEEMRMTAEKDMKVPDVILVDIHLNGAKGTEVIQKLKQQFTSAEIIIITGEYRSSYIKTAVENGASGYLVKPFTMMKLNEAIQNVERTGSFLDPMSLTKLLAVLKQEGHSKKNPSTEDLTPAENRVLDAVKDGLTYNEIAQKLNISYYLVNYHLRSIYSKMDVRSKAELLSRFV